MAKQVKKWITINGNHVPVYEDGSMGGFMEGKKSSQEGKYKNDFQNKADEYREKFLTKRSDEEIEEIKKNLDKSTAIVGTTEDDHVAYRAIRDEQERRKRDKLSRETYDNRTYAELNDAQKKSIDEELSGKESWSKMQTERSTKEASDIFKNQQEKERRAEANKGKSLEDEMSRRSTVKVGDKELSQYDSWIKEGKQRLEYLKDKPNSGKEIRDLQDDIRKWEDRASQIRNESSSSIKIGDKEAAVSTTPLADKYKRSAERSGGMSIHDTRIHSLLANTERGHNNISTMSLADLKDIATYGLGMKSSEIRGMNEAELRKMILAMWRKG